MPDPRPTSATRLGRLSDWCMRQWAYVSSGIWSDPRKNWWLNVLRTVNLSVRSFLNRDIQSQACAMTYRTMLAIVPAMALLIAIGRGFGFQSLLQDELFHLLPAQRQAIGYVLGFVDSYLNQASEGIFVGVGIVFLIYTLISLLGNVEDTFNLIWGQKRGRSLWRKVSDYTAVLLILPVLMICASGLNLLLSSTLDAVFNFSFMTPVISAIAEGGSWLMTWLFFTAAYMMIPYAKVRFVNAFISGAIAGTGFLVLQWLFVTGTLYVTRYNAIYGSFAFLPLMLLWVQLVWMIILAGAVVCYSSQNVFAFSFDHEVSTISPAYRSKIMLAIASVLAHRFTQGTPAVSAHELIDSYGLPARLVTAVTDRLCEAGIVSRVVVAEGEANAFQLAVEPSKFSVAMLYKKNYNLGASDFVPGFSENFPGVDKAYASLTQALREVGSDVLLCDLPILQPIQTEPLTNR